MNLFPKSLFMLNYCLDRHKSQEISDKAADAFLPTLIFLQVWFATNKVLRKRDDVVVL